MRTGIVVLGHGSRKAEAQEGFHSMVELIRRSFPCELVASAFMGNQSPGLAEAIDGLVAGGVQKVVIAPLFLFSGVHVMEDIPSELERERRRYGERLEIVYAGILGADPRIADVVSARIKEAL